MADGCVYISESTANALDTLDIGDFYKCNSWERMAAAFFILKEVPDDETIFPRGKWATIQEIERQVQENARVRSQEIAHR